MQSRQAPLTWGNVSEARPPTGAPTRADARRPLGLRTPPTHRQGRGEGRAGLTEGGAKPWGGPQGPPLSLQPGEAGLAPLCVQMRQRVLVGRSARDRDTTQCPRKGAVTAQFGEGS